MPVALPERMQSALHAAFSVAQANNADPVSALAEVAHLARGGETQAAIHLYRESQDSSREEAQRVVEVLRMDLQAQPDWVVEGVRLVLRSSQASEVRKPQSGSNSSRVRLAALVLLGMMILIFLLAFLLLNMDRG
jgi:hypothetical protein